MIRAHSVRKNEKIIHSYSYSFWSYEGICSLLVVRGDRLGQKAAFGLRRRGLER